MTGINKWNVIFLVDSETPSKIILLKRSPKKEYAPNYFTGIGGKIGDLPGLENETPVKSAYRELQEETLGQLNSKNIRLFEFARSVYESGDTLYYFWGIYNHNNLPSFDPADGKLVQIDAKNLLRQKIIPTTRAVCEEWQKRSFALHSPFTVFLKHIGTKGSVRLVEVINIKEGLN